MRRPAHLAAALLVACGAPALEQKKQPWSARAPGVDAPPADAGLPAAAAERLAMLRGNCGAGVPGACLAVGRLWEGGELGVRRDLDRAAEGYGDACAALSVEGCRELDRLLGADDTMPRDVGRYVRVLDGACYRRQADACVALGKLHAYGIGVPESGARAEELWTRACDLNHGGGCWLLARVQLRRAEVADGDPTPALRVEERACALGEQRACVASAERYLRNTLGQSTRYWYSAWDGTGRAHERLRVACSSGEGRGCMAFADAYVDGLGLPQSKEKARELLRKICDGGHGASCVQLGDLERENGLPDAAQQAERSWRRACELRDGEGCHRLARLAMARGSPKDALPLYERGCMLRAPAACQDLGRLYLDGNGVARDPARGAALVEKGCRFGGAGCATGHAAAALR